MVGFGSVAQLAVHFAVNKKVVGSNPTRTVFTTFSKKVDLLR
jgi:hypothetical protein